MPMKDRRTVITRRSTGYLRDIDRSGIPDMLNRFYGAKVLNIVANGEADAEGKALIEAMVAESGIRIAGVYLEIFGNLPPKHRALTVGTLTTQFRACLESMIEGAVPVDVLAEESQAEDGGMPDFGEIVRASRARRAAAEPTEAPDAGMGTMSDAIDKRMREMVAAAERAAKPERVYTGDEIKAMRTDPPQPMPAESIPAPGQVRVHRHDVDGPAPITPPTRIDDGE